MKKFITILFALTITASAQDYQGFITKWEGAKNEVYTCPAGYKTIGVGHKLLPHEDYEFLSDAQIAMLFGQDFNIAYGTARKYVVGFDSRPEIVKLILVDFSFNVGETTFAKFKKMIKACNDYDYSKMSDELMDSNWYNQVGRRSRHHCARLKEL